jgi:hypothetical protein
MLFSRLLDPSCSYCRFGRPIGGGEIACVKRGITSENGRCRKFKYDPLRRVPERRQHPFKSIMPPDMEETPEEAAPDELARMQAEIDRLRSALFQPPVPVKEPLETPEAALIAESAAQRLSQAKLLEEKVSAELAKEFAPEVMPAAAMLEQQQKTTALSATPGDAVAVLSADADEPVAIEPEEPTRETPEDATAPKNTVPTENTTAVPVSKSSLEAADTTEISSE